MHPHELGGTRLREPILVRGKRWYPEGHFILPAYNHLGRYTTWVCYKVHAKENSSLNVVQTNDSNLCQIPTQMGSLHVTLTGVRIAQIPERQMELYMMQCSHAWSSRLPVLAPGEGKGGP